MKMISLAGGLIAAMALAGTAHAVNIVTPSARTSVVDLTTAANKNLSNNGFYASGDGNSAIAYLFNEGSNIASNNATTQALGIAGQSVQTYLLHYDRQNSRFLGGLATGSVSGSFGFQLAANEVLLGLVGYSASLLGAPGQANALRDTDFASGVTYPNTTFTTLLFRGTEGNFFGDSLSLSSPAPATGPATVNVNYNLSTTGSSVDEVRFFIGTIASPGAVPEPATWATMVGGFGLVGGALRRRARRTLAAA